MRDGVLPNANLIAWKTRAFFQHLILQHALADDIVRLVRKTETKRTFATSVWVIKHGFLDAFHPASKSRMNEVVDGHRGKHNFVQMKISPISAY